MINKQKINFAEYSTFLSKKISASPDNSSYTLGLSGDIIQGEPDIKWLTICFIKNVLKIWAGGLIYDCRDLDDSIFVQKSGETAYNDLDIVNIINL